MGVGITETGTNQNGTASDIANVSDTANVSAGGHRVASILLDRLKGTARGKA